MWFNTRDGLQVEAVDGYHGVGLITLGSGSTLGSAAEKFGGSGGMVGIWEVGGGVTGRSAGDTEAGGGCEVGFGQLV